MPVNPKSITSSICLIGCLSAFVFIDAVRLATGQGPTEMATVTFYTHGSTWKSGVPGSKHSVFYGGIFDGRDHLFTFLEGMIVKNNRRLTLAIPAGDHQFAASYSSKGPEQPAPTIHLIGGAHYYFRALSESSGVVVLDWEKGHLDQVNCQTAVEEMADSKVLKPRHNPPKLVAMTAHDQSFTTCP